MAEPIRIAVVGHTNAGKTSLLRTLTRRGDFGQVSEQPGTTRHVEEVALMLDGRCAVRLFDTPGLEDSVALLDHLQAFEGALTRPERVRAFLQGPEARRSFEQEAKVLRRMLEIDAAFYVIDSREPVLPKFRAEVEILGSCAKPVMPVLNFVRHPDSREAQWQEALAAHGLHALARFDAVAPFVGSEQQLYRDLITLVRSREAELNAVVAGLERERQERHASACRLIASLLIDVTALRRTLDQAELADPATRQRLLAEFRNEVIVRARAGIDELLEVYAFRKDEAEFAALPGLAGRWAADLFNPEVLATAARQLGTGAAIGASVGLVADAALAGLSLGAAAALGAAVGGALSQGFGHLGRSLANRARGLQDLSVEDAVLALLAERMLRLLRALEQRGHAALDKLVVGHDGTAPTQLGPVLRALRPARGRPDWRLDASRRRASDPRRERLVTEVAEALRQAYAAAA